MAQNFFPATFYAILQKILENILDKLTVEECLSELDIAQSKSVDMNFTKFKKYISRISSVTIDRSQIRICPEEDQLPTKFIQANIYILGLILKTIVNKSIASGTICQTYKEAVVSPIIIKAHLEQSLSNFRPVSTLSFILNIIEKVVFYQINA